MQYVSSLGGPRVMLPTSDIERWIAELGDNPKPDEGLYGLACSIDNYCGIISPWNTPLLIFGDTDDDMYFLPEQYDGLFFRWIAANSLEQLTDFAVAVAGSNLWDETTHFDVFSQDMTLMDTCTFMGDTAPRINVKLRTGSYSIMSRYVTNTDVSVVVHRLKYI